MTKLERNDVIKIFPKGGSRFEVTDTKGNVLLGEHEEFHIYLKNAQFIDGVEGHIKGRYMGETDGRLNDGYARDLTFVSLGHWIIDKRTQVSKARLVSVNNKTAATVIVKAEDPT